MPEQPSRAADRGPGHLAGANLAQADRSRLVRHRPGGGGTGLPDLLAGADPGQVQDPPVRAVRDRTGPSFQHRHPPGRVPDSARASGSWARTACGSTSGPPPSSTRSGAFPVQRGTPDREALRICEDALRGGEPVVLFPEGTRQSGPTVQPLFEGAAFVAARAGRADRPRRHRGQRVGHAQGDPRDPSPVKVVMVVGRSDRPAARAREGGCRRAGRWPRLTEELSVNPSAPARRGDEGGGTGLSSAGRQARAGRG